MSEVLAAVPSPLPKTVFASERTQPRETALDRALVGLQARLWTPFARTRARYLGRIVLKANAHADRLRELDDDSLRSLARDVRLALRRNAKPRERDIALCFALIREAAHRMLGQRHYD